jgi:hypothetical protein
MPLTEKGNLLSNRQAPQKDYTKGSWGGNYLVDNPNL